MQVKQCTSMSQYWPMDTQTASSGPSGPRSLELYLTLTRRTTVGLLKSPPLMGTERSTVSYTFKAGEGTNSTCLALEQNHSWIM